MEYPDWRVALHCWWLESRTLIVVIHCRPKGRAIAGHLCKVAYLSPIRGKRKLTSNPPKPVWETEDIEHQEWTKVLNSVLIYMTGLFKLEIVSNTIRSMPLLYTHGISYQQQYCKSANISNYNISKVTWESEMPNDLGTVETEHNQFWNC